MTTSEISKFGAEYELKIEEFNNLINLLNRADLAKYAKYKFSVQDQEENYKWMLNFISNFNDAKVL